MLLVFTKIALFAYCIVDKMSDMVDNYIKKVEILLAVFTCLCLFSPITHAQSDAEEYLVVNRLSRENGLPDQDINGLYFDSMGYAWISTFGGGLVRYDGDSFIRFSARTDPAFISDFVNPCCEDGYGRLWIPCAGGMNLLDLKTLTLIDDIPGFSGIRRHALLSSESVTRDARGCMWFTSGDKLYRVAFADDGNRFLVDSLQCQVSNANLMSAVADVDNDGSAWIALNGRFFKVRHVEGRGLCMSETLPSVDIGPDNKATAYLRSGNELWIGTQKGLYRANIASGNYFLYQHDEADRHSLPNDEITGLCLSSEGETVIGTLGGVSVYNAASRSFDTYGSRPNAYGNKLLPGEMVRCIVSRNGQVWVGLEAEGLAVLQRKPLQIVNPSHIECTTASIPSTPVRSLFIDSRDVLWLATTGYGLCRQVGDLVFRNYNTNNSALSDNAVTSFCEDGHGRVWFGTVTGHLDYINMDGPDVIHHPEGHTSPTARSIDVIIGLTYDSVNDFIWIVARCGLYYYDLKRSTYVRYSGSTSSCMAACITSGQLWVSSIEGLSIIDLNTLEARTLEDFPYCMALVPDGDAVWVGTYGRGIFRIEDGRAERSDMKVYTEQDGLVDNQVHGLLVDGIYLWITTENGLSRLDTQVGVITSYGLRDGLKSMAFCENSTAKGSDGTIYFGQKEGLSILRSSYVRNDSGNKPEVVISGYWCKEQFHSLSMTDTIDKDEKDTDFTLKFSDLSYGQGTDVLYESRILPIEQDWNPVFENDTHVKFGHIPGGKYRIQIRAVDRNGNVLSQDEKTLEVRPVLYRRGWFRTLAFLVFVLIAYLIALWYTRSVNRSRDLLRREVERQTKILNDQKKELERKADELSEQNALLQKQNEMIASHNTLLSKTITNKDSDFSARLLEAIQKKYKDPDLDVHGLAEEMGMSRSLLNDKIQQALGQSIAQFIRTYRLNVAKEMICNGTNKDMNISEIAYEVGFNDPKYFTRCFTKEFNATPSDLFRENN